MVGLPDEEMGRAHRRRRSARPGREIDTAALAGFVKERIGSVKTPKQIEVWTDLPRSRSARC